VPEIRAHIDFALDVLPDGHTSVCAGSGGGDPGNPKYRGIPNRSIDEMLDLQGLPRDLFDHSPLTMQGKRKLIGNAVPLPMAEALGRAVAEAMR
jgi:site-specific DNA-cytosine methylase